jgi:4-hydroxybenzoate polyprenyltransferase
LILVALGFLLGAYVSFAVIIIYATYIILNLSYTLSLKNIVILDVFCISAGFMLRIFAGTRGVGIPPSKWLIICGFMITLFLGFAKRRAEIFTLKDRKEEHRKVLQNYSNELIDLMMAISAASAIITYSLYTLSPQTISTHKTDALIYTVPFVVYGIFRYIYILLNANMGGSPSRDLVRDPHIIVTVLGWALTTLWINYFHGVIPNVERVI